jgi:hypothetical protein
VTNDKDHLLRLESWRMRQSSNRSHDWFNDLIKYLKTAKLQIDPLAKVDVFFVVASHSFADWNSFNRQAFNENLLDVT